MAKVRYISDGRISFVKVTVVLQDGRTLMAIDDTVISNIDANWRVYLSRAKEKWGSKMDTFQVVQLSKFDPEVKQYIKDSNIHLPSLSEDEKPDSFQEFTLAEDAIREIQKKPVKGKHQPGKYRS
jgi:hypothetical protein